MKARFGGLLVACGLAIVGCGGTTPSVTHLEADRVVMLDSLFVQNGVSDTLRLGRMGSGETIKTDFEIVNHTGRVVVVEGYTTSCGCTQITYDSQPLRDGASKIVSLQFDSSGMIGWQLKLVRLNIAGFSRPLKLYIDATVE